MQTSFCLSGFLYNLKTHKILLLKLQKADSADFLWSTLGGEGSDGEETRSAFKRIMNEQLDLNLKPKDIYPIYDYFHEEKDKSNYVFYAQVKSTRKFNNFKEGTFSWISFHEVSKLSFTPHSKQDVIVGERVINAKWRDDEAKKEQAIP